MYLLNVYYNNDHSSFGYFLFEFFLFLLPSLPYPNGDVTAKSTNFSLSTLTRNDGEFTNLFPTL